MRSSSGAVFLRCRHPALPKYPPMPVVRCPYLAIDPVLEDGTDG